MLSRSSLASTHATAYAMPLLALAGLAFSTLTHAQAVEDDAWHFNAGVGLMSQPTYPGSSETRTGALPTFGARKGRWQLGAVPGAGVPLGVGYTLMQDGPWRMGVGVGTDLGRSRNGSESSKFSNLGAIEQTALGSLSGSYTQGALAASANIITDIGGHQQGTRALLDLSFRTRPMERLVLSAGPGMTWTDGRYAQTYYGVSAAQSASSGYATYKARAGLNAWRLGASADYQLTHEWSLSAKLGVTQLQGDAANSPSIDKKTQTSYGLFANYRF
mgnify:CR=1 FL=1